MMLKKSVRGNNYTSKLPKLRLFININSAYLNNLQQMSARTGVWESIKNFHQLEGLMEAQLLSVIGL